ncbi:TraB/GumN family protein [Prevotella sp. KH2C16]|uniref:TraB/GumN family protein n=1 Tax=Prevotella sp. KH2C16 TaxID=1855325 RepID=UPI0008F0E836|nr:TraB/GumN family protein [Prevotella sp. KH2C16]SFG30890.1 hypothetical protein SAMN05216383_10978 [Prevotella sp. KH2C16]
MKRLFTFALLTATCVLGANAQLLYKISGKGLSKPSYIIGTYHFCPDTFVDSIPGLREAMRTTEAVYGEVVNDSMMQPEGLQEVQKALMMPEGKTFTSLYTSEEMTRINAFLTKHMGADFTNPMVAQQLDKLSPTALATTMTAILCTKKQGSQLDAAHTIDIFFQNWGKEQGKKIGGLETLAFQIKMLFTRPLDRQAQVFLCMADNEDFNNKVLDLMLEGYFKQDIKMIEESINLKLNNSCDDTPEERAELIDNRNADWLTKMPAIMKAQPTLFAVGAGHLVGEKGVLALLRKAGYTVEGVR